MNRKATLRAILLSGLSILALTAPTQVLAQNANLATYDEIIVTAQKRSQSINEVGLSISALSANTLENRGINDTSDLVSVVPGLTFTPTLSGPPVYTLRGVGFYESSLAAAPAVTVYVDEAPLAFPIMTQVGVLDLERVEVMKGPQGTLFGENSTGGAINYITAKPTDSFEAGVSMGFARFSQVDAKGFVSGPLSDTLRGRFAFRVVEGGAWQKSYTRDDKLGDTSQQAGRILLDWTPTDRLTVGLNLTAWRDRSDYLANQLQAVECANPLNCPFSNYPTAPQNARAADWTPTWPMRVRDDFRQATLRVDYELTNDVTLTSLTGYQHLKSEKYSDSDAMNIENLDTRNLGKIESFNQELRLSGETGPVNWVAGAYYSHAKVFDEFYYATETLSSSSPIPGLPGFTSTSTPTETKLNTYAAFGNVDVSLTDQLSLVAGIRYTESKRDFGGCTRDLDGRFADIINILQLSIFGSIPNPVAQGGCVVFDENFVPGYVEQKLNENNVSWRTGLNWQLDNGTLLYGVVSKGYKSGSVPAVSSTSVVQFTPVPQESLLAYEVGIKAPLADDKLQLNASAFYYDYKDKQLRGRIDDMFFGLLETLVSIPKSRVWGLEGEITARPIDGLHLSGSITYMETEVRRFTGIDPTGTVTDFAGAEFPYSPKWQASFDAQYSWLIMDDKRAFVGGSLTHHSTSYSTIGAYTDFRIRPYTLIDLRAGIESEDGQWRISVWGKNITNKYYWNGVFQFIDTRFRLPARPATYGVTVGLNF